MRIYVTVRTTDEAIKKLESALKQELCEFIYDGFNITKHDDFVTITPNCSMCFTIKQLTRLQDIIHKSLNTNDKIAIF